MASVNRLKQKAPHPARIKSATLMMTASWNKRSFSAFGAQTNVVSLDMGVQVQQVRPAVSIGKNQDSAKGPVLKHAC
jgi:hypothetical protein